jgi:hypothetical protein
MKFGIRRAPLVEVLERWPVIGPGVGALYNRWLSLRYHFAWSFGSNPRSRSRFRRHRPHLSPVQQGILGELKSRGVALTSFDALIGKSANWDRLLGSVKAFAESTEVREGVQAYNRELERASAGLPHSSLDKYWMTLYPIDATPTVRLDDEWLRFALDPSVLDVVNSYFGLWAKLIYFDLWHTIPVRQQAMRFGSQKWHRDPEDRIKLRLYLYFADVNESAGPLQYAPGSHLGGPLEGVLPWRGPFGKTTPPQEEFERRIPASTWVTCTGRAGTLVLCDTIGLHRGGVSTDSARVLATWAFVTPASLHKHRFRVDWSSPGPDLTEEARFAIS